MSQRRTVLGVAATASLLAAGAAPLRAQEFFAGAQGGTFDMTSASRSLKAVVDSSSFATFGIEGGYGLRRGLYAAVGGSFSPEKKGQRVFLASSAGPPFKLGLPLALKRNLAYLNAGWRFLQDKRLVPYAGIGVEFVSFKEESVVAGESFSQSQTETGFRGLVGVEFKATSRLRVGVEAIGSTVPNAIGVGGVSKVYGEDDIGGFTVLGKMIFSFPRKASSAPTGP